MTIASLLVCSSVAEPRAVWIQGAESEMNAFYGFAATFAIDDKDVPVLNFSASSIARVYVNGKLAAYGPARAPHGYMRIDRWPLSDYVRTGTNIVAIEVLNPAVNTFYLPERKGFLFAEVRTSNNRILAETGKDFKAIELPRVRKTNRFCYQREFSEFYSVTPESFAWRTNGIQDSGLRLVVQPKDKMLERGAPYPTLAFDGTFQPTFKTRGRREQAVKAKTIECIEQGGCTPYRGFKKEELEINMGELTRYVLEKKTKVTSINDVGKCEDGEGIVFASKAETSGFPYLEVDCLRPATLWILMDEFAGQDGLPNITRFINCVNACGWRLEKPGRYTLEGFQPNGIGCAHVLVEGGSAVIKRFDVRTYANPMPARADFRCSDQSLEKVFAAACRSLAYNAVDVFTDCPGRERGAYFGDTLFTGRGADVLLGDIAIEGTLFENFSYAKKFKELPEGMIPMCYPGDVTLSKPHWIPAFGLWSVIELAEYVKRSGDERTVEAYRKTAEGLLRWFRSAQNRVGLLENLPGWVFVEWSEADRFTSGINVPTNMIYIRFLESFAELYGRIDCTDQAEALRTLLRKTAWSGEWFSDQLVRQEDGTLIAGKDCTEVCQTLALFSGVATREGHPILWKRFLEDLGPMRKPGQWERIWPSDMLFGFSLRFGMLTEWRYDRRVLMELQKCCLPMAVRTGTLWEGVVGKEAGDFSTCHGFPCQAAWVIANSALGVRRIDRRNRHVVIGMPSPDVELEWCEGKIPLSADDYMSVRWKRDNGKIDYVVKLPVGWQRDER